VLVKLEGLQGAALHTLEVEMAATPPDVLLLGRRVFRFVRTDGVWDKKSHVYREATMQKVDRSAARKLSAAQKRASQPEAAAGREPMRL
jgi:hypothetical protein